MMHTIECQGEKIFLTAFFALILSWEKFWIFPMNFPIQSLCNYLAIDEIVCGWRVRFSSILYPVWNTLNFSNSSRNTSSPSTLLFHTNFDGWLLRYISQHFSLEGGSHSLFFALRKRFQLIITFFPSHSLINSKSYFFAIPGSQYTRFFHFCR